jgi:predicted nucleotidyltransferase
MREVHDSADEIKEKIAPLFEDPGLRLVLLFGSRASGRTHGGSDIDLGFLYDHPVDFLDLTNRAIVLLHTDRVDVVDLRRANSLLGFSACQGRLLYERTPGQFAAFFSLSFRKYVDTKKLRDAQKTAIRNFLQRRKIP